MHLPAPARILVKSLLRLALVLIFAGIPLALAYAKFFGIGFGFPARVSQALSFGGFETSIGRLSFDPLRGLVAEGVEVASDSKEVAIISRIAVSLNLSALASGRILVDQIRLDDSSAKFPVTTEPGRPGSALEIQHMKSEVVFLDNQLHITDFNAEIQGIRVRGTGIFKNPEVLKIGESPGNSDPSKIKIADLLKFFSGLKYVGQPLTLSFDVRGDFADPAAMEVAPISVRSGPIEGEGWRVEGVEAEARYLGGDFFLDRMTLFDRVGTVRVWATLRNRFLNFEADSSASLQPFMGLLSENEIFSGFKLEDPPRLSVQGTGDLTGGVVKIAATGAFEFGAFSMRGVRADGLRGDFAWRDGKVFLRDTRLIVGGDEAEVDVLYSPGDFRLRAISRIKPTAIAPLLDSKAREMLARMKFQDSPVVTISLRGPGPNFKLMTGEGSIYLGKTAMRDIWIDRANSSLQIGNGAVTYRDFSLFQGSEFGKGTFTYDFAGQQVRLENVVSTLDPVGVLMWVDPKIADAVRPYRFNEPPSVRANGSIHMKDLSKNNLALKVESPEGLDYDLLGKTLRLGKTSATVDVIGATVRARVKRSQLLGGEVAVSADVSIDPAKPVFSAEADVRRVDFAKLTKLYFNFDTSKGVVSGKYKFSAPTLKPAQMKGRGSIRVEEGNVFAIPILGPLSDIINKILPGAGYQTARLATSDFEIAKETISTENLEIEGAGFSLFGRGDIFFMTDQMDMSVRINARGLPGVVLFPVSKLFEYVSTGTVSKPEWRPKIIPRISPKKEPPSQR